jgi:hypothetical protein
MEKCDVNVTGVSAGEGSALEVSVSAVDAAVMITATELQAPGAKFGSPEYVQVMLSVPTGSVDVARVATPAALRGDVPREPPLLKNSTVPVGVPVCGGTAVAVTVRVTVVPKAAGLGVAVRVSSGGAMPRPFSGTICVEPGILRLLSVGMSLPLSGPPAIGVKLMS